MAYISLYRKYRSQSFGEVMGQQHITTVLQNAIRMGRISHAYLFCGPRGCGKTSTARLLARALCCQKSDGPTAEPCGVCSLCTRIRAGSSMDVIEMDAASETGIDDVREKIIENAKFSPAEARFKVYIIDEVHDLSLKAFDSLLKTIEEPPAHVVFILATTEKHKVPITVRSRCQLMDFRRGSLQDLIGNLRRVLEAESIEYEPEAVVAVARAAEGSFRDSLSLLEQALAYTDGKLTADAVHASIGTVGAELLDSVIQTIASDDLNSAFVKAGELVETGKDVKQTIIALQLHLRDLLVASTAMSPQALPEVSPERFGQMKEQARGFSPNQILKMLDVLADTERDLRFTNQHRLLLERAFWSILPSSLAAAPAASVQPAPVPAAVRSEQPARTLPAPAPREPAPPASPVPVQRQSAPSEASTEASRFAQEIDLDGIRRIWPRVVRRLIQSSKSAGAIFTDDVTVTGFSGRIVSLGFPGEFARGRADTTKGREAVEQALAAELGGQGLKIKCVLIDSTEPSGSPEAIAPSMDLLQPSIPVEESTSSSTAAQVVTVEDNESMFHVANGSAHAVEAPRAAEAAPAGSPRIEEHNAFVEVVKKELDCLPLED